MSGFHYLQLTGDQFASTNALKGLLEIELLQVLSATTVGYNLNLPRILPLLNVQLIRLSDLDARLQHHFGKGPRSEMLQANLNYDDIDETLLHRGISI
jgi:hypothetical protein